MADADRSALKWSLLLLFALTMTAALGIKVPLDASVFSATAGAFLLSCLLNIRLALMIRYKLCVERPNQPMQRTADRPYA
jgi:hypothetical protein